MAPIDCNVLFNSLCRIPKSARQSIPEDQCSSNVLCESVRPHLTHTQREECISLSVTHHVHPRRALHFTSSITYHVEPLHITYIHVDGVVHTKRSGSSFRSICRSFLFLDDAARRRYSLRRIEPSPSLLDNFGVRIAHGHLCRLCQRCVHVSRLH